jgi:cysteate synthase
MTVRDDLVQSAGGHEKDELQSSIHLRDREPAYSTKGEIFEVLIETQGDMLVADNLDALHAKRLFEETEGIDIDPESAVTFAALLKAAWYDGIEKEALVLLNVTEAGR